MGVEMSTFRDDEWEVNTEDGDKHGGVEETEDKERVRWNTGVNDVLAHWPQAIDQVNLFHDQRIVLAFTDEHVEPGQTGIGVELYVPSIDAPSIGEHMLVFAQCPSERLRWEGQDIDWIWRRIASLPATFKAFYEYEDYCIVFVERVLNRVHHLARWGDESPRNERLLCLQPLLAYCLRRMRSPKQGVEHVSMLRTGTMFARLVQLYSYVATGQETVVVFLPKRVASMMNAMMTTESFAHMAQIIRYSLAADPVIAATDTALEMMFRLAQH